MKIKRKSIRSFDKYFGFLKKDQRFCLATSTDNVSEEIAVKIGFKLPLSPGQRVLPSANFGPSSRFNALGKEIKRKDLPMETAYRTVEWHWEQWNGPYDTVPRSKFVDVSYKKYPRDFIAPPSEEIKIVEKKGSLYLASRVLHGKDDSKPSILHLANLFLEIFGGIEVVSDNLESFYSPKEKRLNWEILPPGQYPWEKVESKLKPLVGALPKGNRPWAWHRISKLRKHEPDFHAIGTGGFRGYVVFGFKDKNLYVLECIQYGNATYVFNENWKEISKLTKAEVIQDGSAKDRIIHLESWSKNIDNLLNK